MVTRTNLITGMPEPFDIRSLPYEVVEFAHDELKEMATRLRFAANCLQDGLPAQKQLRVDSEILERRAAALLYEHCAHEFEWITQPGTVHGPAEHFHVCKHCGAEDQDGD